MKSRRVITLSLVQLILIPVIALGQSANETFHSTSEPNIFKNDQGATIEYIGMQNWTAEEIQDSLKSLAPNRPVHACMAVLKQNLGFAESMVMSYFSGDIKSLYTVVTVVEDDHNLSYLPIPQNEKTTIEKWTGELDLDNRRNQNLLSNGLQFLEKVNDSLILSTDRINKSSFYSEEDSKFLVEFYNHIKDQNSEKDRALAHETIQNDGNVLNRILASVILLNFDGNKEEKYMMLDQMRSKDSQISRFSATVLNIMTKDSSKVDWSGATESIQALIAGTNLHNLGTTLEILTRTKISSSLADQILSDNTFLLKERLKVKHEETRKETLAFTSQISGKDITTSEEGLKWLTQF